MLFRPSGQVSGSSVLYRDHRKGPGGPPGGATCPGGPHGLKWGGEPAHSGLVRPPSPLALYIVGGREGSNIQALGASLLPCNTSLSLSRRSSAKPCRRPATSTTTPSCYWISINLSSPLAGSRRRIRHPLRMCVEHGGVVHSALGHQ